MGRGVVEAVNSPNVKLLYDIYHMQIMEGDLIATIQANFQWMGHFHTGGVPGRHELDGTQEVQWDGVMRAIAAAGFKGYVAHEFVPVRDPLTQPARRGGPLRCVSDINYACTATKRSRARLSRHEISSTFSIQPS